MVNCCGSPGEGRCSRSSQTKRVDTSLIGGAKNIRAELPLRNGPQCGRYDGRLRNNHLEEPREMDSYDDPDHCIVNPRSLEADLSGTHNRLHVKVSVVPKGV
jgi:hypothetical protein